MSRDYFFFYFESSVFCFLIFASMLLNVYRNGNRQEKQVYLDRVTMAHMLYFLNDLA